MPDAGHRLAAIFAGKIDHTTGLDFGDYGTAIQYGWANHVRASILQTGPAVESNTVPQPCRQAVQRSRCAPGA